MSKEIISVKDLNFLVNGKNILKNIDFTVYENEIVGIIGPNGTGKTTLLNLISGSLQYSSGEIKLFEKNIKHYKLNDLARLRAVVTQTNHINFNFEVEDIIKFGSFPQGKKMQNIDEQFALISETLDIREYKNRLYQELSGGEKQRVNFARALMQNTPLILLDEPTSAMDIYYQETLMQTIKKYGGSSKTIVIIMHDLSLAAAYCSKLILLDKGRIRKIGTPTEVLNEKIISEVYNYPIKIEKKSKQNFIIVPCRNL